MNLKAMIYNVGDQTEIDRELLNSLNDEDSKALKTKAALVNYVKKAVKSKSKWDNVTANLTSIEATADDSGVVVKIGFNGLPRKPFEFNAVVVYDETDAGLVPYSVQIFNAIDVSERTLISAITITIAENAKV